jgi:peroxiredoxin
VSLYHLPPGLPVPVDDGACDHVEGLRVPSLVLDSSQGQIDLGDLAATRAVLYIYPRTGRPDRPVPEEWDAVPGARGCTPQSCAFRDRAVDLGALGVWIAGLSSQPIEEQAEFAAREHIPFPVIADPALELARALRLPTFGFDGATLYRRVTLLLEAGAVTKVFYPVFPPDRNAEAVIEWLRSTERHRVT